MEKKYTEYTVEELSQDILFVRWILRGEGKDEWENFLRDNPQMDQRVETARNIVSKLRFVPREISREEISLLYQEIDRHLSDGHVVRPAFRRTRLLKYAAVFFCLLVLAATLPFFLKPKHPVSFPLDSPQSYDTENAQLITAGGQQILIKNEQSDLAVDTAGNRISIDRDTTIQLEEKVTELARLVVPFGKRSNLQLADGTRVWLNAGSQLAFPQKFAGRERRVYLKGEAYFEVSRDEDRSFVVSTGQMDIRVHGTRFNVNSNDMESRLEVVLVEGSVGLLETGKRSLFAREILLVPNQRAIYDKTGTGPRIESNVDVFYYTSWKEGLLEFRNESLRTIFDKLSRYYNVQFVADKDLKMSYRASGKLDLKESVEVVLKVVADVTPLDFRMEGRQVFVSEKEGSK